MTVHNPLRLVLSYGEAMYCVSGKLYPCNILVCVDMQICQLLFIYYLLSVFFC